MDTATLLNVTSRFWCSLADRMKFRVALHNMLMDGQRVTLAMLAVCYGLFWFQVAWAPFDQSEEAINTPFCPLQEKSHTFVLRGLSNISEAPENPPMNLVLPIYIWPIYRLLIGGDVVDLREEVVEVVHFFRPFESQFEDICSLKRDMPRVGSCVEFGCFPLN
jgi:hypothetical protein